MVNVVIGAFPPLLRPYDILGLAGFLVTVGLRELVQLCMIGQVLSVEQPSNDHLQIERKLSGAPRSQAYVIGKLDVCCRDMPRLFSAAQSDSVRIAR